MFWFIFACGAEEVQTEKENPTVVDTGVFEDPAGDENSERFVLSTQMILNRSGRIFIWDRENRTEVWSLANPEDPVWSDARMSLEGDLLWHNVVDVKNHDPNLSEFRAINFNGDIVDRIELPGAHHSFDILPDGSLVSIVSEIRETVEHGNVAGDKIVRISNGEEEVLFSAFSVMDPEPLTQMWNHGQYEDAKDWTHMNCIRWHQGTESLILTVPGVNAMWSVGLDGKMRSAWLGKDMDIEPYLDGEQMMENPYPVLTGGDFELPHGGSLDDEGNIWVMSTGVGPASHSEAQGYKIGEEGLIQLEAFRTENEGHSAGLGGVVKLESDGNLLVNWGIFGVIEEIAEEGQRVWQIEAELQKVFGISTTFDDMSGFIGNSD